MTSGEFLDAGARELSRLLAKFAEHDLDQHALWRVDVPRWDRVCITVSTETLPGVADADESVRIWPLAPHLELPPPSDLA